MSKKDKDKRKKTDGGRERGPAWMADLRPPQRGSVRPAAPAATTASGDVPLPAPPSDDVLLDPSIPHLRPVTIDTPLEDLGEETMSDIAPIGPTEYAGATAPESTASPGAGPAFPYEDAVPRSPASMEQLQRQIRDLEARLDDMINHGVPVTEATPKGPRAAAPGAPDWDSSADLRGDLPASIAAVAPPDPSADLASPARATAHDLLPEDFYRSQWGRAGRRRRAEEVDEFGHDPKYEARFLPFFDFLYNTYFRVETQGIEHIPAEGRCLVVANHSGGPLPYDGIMLRTTVRREHGDRSGASQAARELRWLAEDFVYYLPFVGTAMNRLGAVRACQENAERLLAGERLVAVFPEGAKGIGKLFRDRYRLQRFGRGGFIRLCLRTGTPIVPAAIVGAEEASPMLYRVEYMAKTLGVPYLPITPTFPALGPLGLLPAPTKWKMTFGEPISFGEHGPGDADDDVLVGRLAERVRGTIQAMLDRTLAGRQSVWFG